MNQTPLFLRYRVLTSIFVLLAIMITGVAALYLPAHYAAESDVALLPSATSSKPYGSNPYLSFSGALPMTAQILSYQMMSPANVKKLESAGYDEPFNVSLAETIADGPILTIDVTGGNEAAVEATLMAVTRDVSVELGTLQSGISASNRITVLPISTGASPALSLSKTARPLAVVLALGLILAFAIPRLVRAARGENEAARHRMSDDTAPLGRRPDKVNA
jgi:hypothetical protein